LEVKGTETLLNEIELLRDLSHPHLLRLEGLFHTDNLIYLVTEHLEGGTLEEAMRHKHTLSGFLLRQMLQDCLSALVYL
jgi:serine/threonine protein kinase